MLSFDDPVICFSNDVDDCTWNNAGWDDGFIIDSDGQAAHNPNITLLTLQLSCEINLFHAAFGVKFFDLAHALFFEVVFEFLTVFMVKSEEELHTFQAALDRVKLVTGQ